VLLPINNGHPALDGAPQRKGWRVAEQPLDAATRLAAQRTRLAQERTLMAWIRTSTSLIAFGFTIFKFFEYLATNERRREPILSPWVLGMIMILLGLTALTLAWIQHRQEMKALRAEVGPMPYSIASIMAGFIAGLGAIALIVVAFRM
jgi:putative membrane protein